MGRKERPRPRLVNVVHETRYGLGRSSAGALAAKSPVGCRYQVRQHSVIEFSWQDLDSSHWLAIHEDLLVACAVLHRALSHG
jgi:hypothetical protein